MAKKIAESRSEQPLETKKNLQLMIYMYFCLNDRHLISATGVVVQIKCLE
jgi:hypothetical protein